MNESYMQIGWTKGYQGSSCHFVNETTICYRINNIIKFISIDGSEKNFLVQGDGVGPICTNPLKELFAYAENSIMPSIFIYSHSDFSLYRELKDGTKLEYSNIVFSSSVYLASLSGLPDYQMILWRYTDGSKLIVHELGTFNPNQLLFNPGDWRQIALASQKQLSVYTIEQSNLIYVIKEIKIKPLPEKLIKWETKNIKTNIMDATSEYHHEYNDIETRFNFITCDLSAVSGLARDELQNFEEYLDKTVRLEPVSLCWTLKGSLLVGCEDGEIFKVELNTMTLRKIPIDFLETKNEKNEDLDIFVEVGSVDFMKLHINGLFTAGRSGLINLMALSQFDRHLSIVAFKNLNDQILTLDFSPSHKNFVVGTLQGMIYMFSSNDLSNSSILVKNYSSKIISVNSIIWKNITCLTLKESGHLQAWDINGKNLSTIFMNKYEEALTLAVSPICYMAVVGMKNGMIYVVSYINQPTIIHSVRLHRGPILAIEISLQGRFIITGSNDGKIMITDGFATFKFSTIGSIEHRGSVKTIATQNYASSIAVALLSKHNPNEENTILSCFLLPYSIKEETKEYYDNKKYEINKMAINYSYFTIKINCVSLALDSQHHIYILANTKFLYVFKLDISEKRIQTCIADEIEPQSVHQGHNLYGGCIRISFNQKWLITSGGDGRIIIRRIHDMKVICSFTAHNFWTNGVQMFDMSPDGSSLYSTGYEGLLYCFKWNQKYMPKDVLDSSIRYYYEEYHKIEARLFTENKFLANQKPVTQAPLPEPEQKDVEAETIAAIESAIAANEIYVQPPILPPVDSTWSEIKETEFLKDEQKKYASTKITLRVSLKTLRKKLKSMIAENAVAPDIEKLSLNEFDLDIDKQMKLQLEADKEIEQLREEKELANISKMFLASVIKRECWDEMEVKGRGISNFKQDLDVYSYPLIKRPKDLIEKTKAAEALRQIEMADIKLMKENIEILSFDDTYIEENENIDQVDVQIDKTSIYGTISHTLGGGNKHLYSQFELISRDQKYIQVLLLKDSIYRMKLNFNAKFNKVYEEKENTIIKVAEKNLRIRKILKDIGRDYTLIVDPEMGVKERPELLFTTKDEEVKVERYLTAEQQERLEEERAAEEERLRREKKDDWRGRGLDQMMAGVLELKREDELKRDVPIPRFMLEKQPEQYNEEEKKIVDEYKRQVKELEEEREKFKKVLEGELAKLQEQVAEILNAFDAVHLNLFKLKIDTETAICQEMLMILRLRYSLLLEEQMQLREEKLKAQLEESKYIAHHAIHMTTLASNALDDFKSEYEMHIAEDKLHEKMFRKEFSDQANFVVEMMYKFYKKRPRSLKGLLPLMPTFNSESENPYKERPSSALQEEDINISFIQAMAELDDYVNIPEGIDRSVWQRMTRYRQEKVAKEMQLKQEALILSEMHAFIVKRREEEETAKLTIDDYISSLQRLRAEKHLFYANIEVQLCLKQGQVEVDAANGEFVINHQNSILLHKDVILDLNKKIMALGNSKIESMIENKDFKKGIQQLEWDYKKMEMEMEDLRNKLKDVASFKVTKEVQRFLTDKNYNESKNQEIMMVEKSILAHMTYHNREVAKKKKVPTATLR